MERTYSPREAGLLLGVTTHTIQVWDRQGKIQCIRLPSGRRRIPESEIKRLLNIKEQRKDAFYCRVSSHDQNEDLVRQQAILQRIAPEAILYKDIKSGLNFKRPGLVQLLTAVQNREIARILVTSEDRLARVGFDLIAWWCRQEGTDIVVVTGQEYRAPQEELVQDLMKVITSFSGELYGLRSRKTKRFLTVAKEVVQEP